ncbi:unnamed protein product [Staurois parvus]|uniref:Uncharacterized protein n=1 Tax=Staurois parvus TaxID=386267 RepID=A0ABN9DZE2_9NEOB|nr:unnamed protein product [Staurois parvus]
MGTVNVKVHSDGHNCGKEHSDGHVMERGTLMGKYDGKGYFECKGAL